MPTKRKVGVAPADTPTDEMPTESPTAVGIPPGFTTRGTSFEELELVPRDVRLTAPAAPGNGSQTYSIKNKDAYLAAMSKTRSDVLKKANAEGKSVAEILKSFDTVDKEFPKEFLKARFGGMTRRKVRIPIKKTGDLVNLGYSMTKKARSRHGALKKAVKKFGRATVSRKLNALAVFNKRRHPLTARKVRSDRKYVMKV